MKRKAAEIESKATTPAPADQPLPNGAAAATAHGLAADIHRYGEDLERRYLVVRDAWLEAMHAANSGRSADLASLAIAQEAYEAVAIERDHWIDSGRVAIPIQADPSRHDVEIAVGQELAWREVLDHKEKPGVFARIKRRLGGR